MSEHILITGGAGFIGAHVVNELLQHGHSVRVLDSLLPQVHGPDRKPPEYLSKDAELVIADVRDAGAVRNALRGIDAVIHLAAAVGVGQSMYEMPHYTSVNNFGTAVLLKELTLRRVRKLVVASSMSVYGEGLYASRHGTIYDSVQRSLSRLRLGEWEPAGPDGEELLPVATPENKPPCLHSVYALSKFDQERMSLLVGNAYGIPATALRLFNVYGPYQALSNPYTGVLAIFSARLINGRRPLINEDGLQRRDFVNVKDVATACRLALGCEDAAGQVFNIGSGHSFTIHEVAGRLARALGKERLEPEITGKFRTGDVRHCFADISRARSVLGYCPAVDFDDGLEELAGWIATQVAPERVDESRTELEVRGLMA
jgi:dTDP-L-rhamnose 4-epimerase